MAREVEQWIGKTDNHRAPSKVRQRVFDNARGICHLCKLPIQLPKQKWDLDHVVALINGGENAEANLKPAHRDCHKEKTRADIAEKVKVAAIRQRHIGALVPPAKIDSAPFRKSTKTAKREAKASGKLPVPSARPMFAQARQS